MSDEPNDDDANAGEAKADDAKADDAKARKGKADRASVRAATHNEADWGRPAFAKDFPANDELARLVEAFARGDYATIRTDGPKLAASTEDEAVKKAAESLRERIEPDPTSKILFVFAALLLAFLTFWWVAHDGPEGGASPATKPVPAPPPKIEKID